MRWFGSSRSSILIGVTTNKILQRSSAIILIGPAIVSVPTVAAEDLANTDAPTKTVNVKVNPAIKVYQLATRPRRLGRWKWRSRPQTKSQLKWIWSRISKRKFCQCRSGSISKFRLKNVADLEVEYRSWVRQRWVWQRTIQQHPLKYDEQLQARSSRQWGRIKFVHRDVVIKCGILWQCLVGAATCNGTTIFVSIASHNG